ncbi:hypothetical protein VNO80_02662 [Phaseolus coccineus]|uniref:Transcription factor n=1 Tax=Phaseolus coccineus TaxID=3886 RepID=A0AAN9RI56_PHACN
MAASRPPTPQSTASSIIPLLRRFQFLPDQTPLQRRFQTLLKGARERWMYAIYWLYSPADSLLCWGDGYYNGNGKAQKTTSPTEQAQRKSVFRLLSSLMSGPSATHDDCDQDVTDPEWFFLLSMSHTFVNGSGLLGQAFSNFIPIWLTGPDRFPEPACQRARQLQDFGLLYWLTGPDQFSELTCQRARQLQDSGLQSMVCIPCPNGVVELASAEVVLPNLDLVIKVRDLINFNGPVADLTFAEIIRPR